MGTTRPANSTLGAMVLVGLLLTMTGCDYWPPALQAQVEQLRSETQTLTMEKTQLQNQLNDLLKVKQDLSTQLDDLGRMNREKTGMINSLQNQLDALRAKTVKAVAPKTPAKTPAKTTVKPAVKQPVKKKPAKKM
jgi:outer membrane murein-binding lipoprotein Lpp